MDTAQLRLVHDVISRLDANRVDTTEYACLKALVLFKPGKLALLHRNNQSQETFEERIIRRRN
jgi:hypothetical protein